ncbi:MAG: hypothetical protein V2B17_02545 [Chloroflexota bacterium]
MFAKTFRCRAVTRPLGRNAMVAFVTLTLLAACAAPAPSATTPLPTIAATAGVGSVCLTVEQSYEDVDGRLADQPIAATAADILRPLGLEVVLGREAGCDAELHINIVLRPLSARYGQDPLAGGGRTCYSGAELVGEATLVVGARDPLTQPFEGKVVPPGVVTKCQSAAEAPFDRPWSRPLVSLLGEWWGLPALVSAIEIGGPGVAGAATAVIAGMGSDAAAVAPFLMDRLRSGDPDTFLGAAWAIVRISPEAAVEAMPLLVTALREGDRATRLGLIRSLGGTATLVPAAAVDALVTALADDEDAYLRAEAVRMLAGLGTAAAAAVPALILAIDDRGAVMGGQAATVGEVAVAALASVGGPAAVPALLEALGRGGRLRAAAIDALEELGAGAVAAAPALIDLLGGDDRGSARSAEEALRAITGQRLGDDPEAWSRWLRTLECAEGTASTEATAAGPDGEITVVVEHAGFVPATFEDTRPCGIFSPPGCSTDPHPVVTALGQFFVLRYVVTNGTAGAIDLPAQCTTASPRRKCSGRTWWLTDGQGSWPTAWYSVWAPWVAAQGGDPDSSMDAGQTAIDWAVFDVPEGFEPAAVSWPLDDGGQACLTWP